MLGVDDEWCRGRCPLDFIRLEVGLAVPHPLDFNALHAIVPLPRERDRPGAGKSAPLWCRPAYNSILDPTRKMRLEPPSPVRCPEPMRPFLALVVLLGAFPDDLGRVAEAACADAPVKHRREGYENIRSCGAVNEDGEKVGRWLRFHLVDRLGFEGHFCDDVMCGRWKAFDPFGELLWDAMYCDGLPCDDDSWERWERGNLWYNGPFRHAFGGDWWCDPSSPPRVVPGCVVTFMRAGCTTGF